ncbi:glycoside hydrolase family 55 protein [Isoptericola sp. S6320L]|uniref:glycoside hydrolase family 55 protein n=1 Tax=Isoptericola sp. S6320L TaxID=2926411 RepID=UPI001FF3A577|nr:glycoside hydrolase family 55 protein [Isoptericola sp. S6320L]MCK0116597.1 glycoside hydrolase family 55 protein [Isoptericola sp. S6320L]
MSSPHAPARATARRRHHRLVPTVAAGAALVTAIATVPGAQAAPPDAAAPTAPDFGPNVTVFGPDTPQDEIQATMDALHAQQVDAEMGTDRHAVYFLPGTYGSAEDPLQFGVGYYTEVAGLGESPQDVAVEGAIEVRNRCLSDDPENPNCIALVNFWRTISNLALDVNTAGQGGCEATTNFWAVSQAVSMRRLDVRGPLSLMDYCTAGPQYASGGFIADSRFDTQVTNGSQQQWLTRNSELGGGWSNAVWNQVFAGVEGAPSEDNFPTEPYTTLDTTPVSREKPYLFVDDAGRYQVRVPAAQTETRGVSWADGATPGRTVPITDFYVAKPGDSVATINSHLARGKHLLLTPGVYDVDRSIAVKRPGTVVLGMGHATLTAVDGAVPLTVADTSGVVVAGVSIDAGTVESPALLRVGKEHGKNHRSDPVDPITLSDVYFRVGGPHVGKADVALEVNAHDVLIDHTWVWRGDHGVEGFPTDGSAGVNGDTERWATNVGRNGVVVNGDRVTATGLFVEHFQEHNTIWNGEDGTVVLYQNELPYDPPTQADWTQPDGTLGWEGYKVADDVERHRLFGAGVYVFNQNNPEIVTENGFSVPQVPGVQLHHVMTVNLSAGTIQHVVNGVGDAVPPSTSGSPEYVVDYPAP